MKLKTIAIMLLIAISLTTTVLALEVDPITGYFNGKILPFIQSVGTIFVIVGVIFGGFKFVKSDDPAEKSKGKNIIIGCVIALALLWLAPALVEYLKPS
ncbi:MAG: hypothetical protein V1859_02205 [archaeon]